MLTVAAADGPLPYQDLADMTGQDYTPLAHQIAALADGRDRHTGLGLLERQPGRHARARLVTCTPEGRNFAQRFVIPRKMPAPDGAEASLRLDRSLSALDAVLERNPKLSLGTFCVYLFIATHPEDFAYEGLPTRIIAEALTLSNLPKHLKILETGIKGAPPSQLIGFHINEYDQRIRLPFLTKAGVALQCALVAALTGKTVEAPRLPHATALDHLESPEDIAQLTDEDFDDIVWE